MTKRVKVSIVLVTITLILVLQVLLYHYHRAQVDRAYTDVKEQLSARAIALTTVIEEKFAALRGIVAFVNTVGFEAGVQTISNFLENIYAHLPDTRTLLLAPKGRIEYVYPFQGNEAILHINYLKPSPLASSESIELTLESKQIVVDGPRELMQGGYGMVLRQAIYNGDVFEGIVTLALDINKILQKASLEDFIQQNPSFSIRKANGEIWFGNAETFSKDYVSIHIPMQNESWELVAAPERSVIQAIWRNSIIMELLGLVSISVVFYSFWNQNRFNQHLERLVQRRTKDLRKANTDLLKAEGELRYQNELLEKRTLELEQSERRYEQLAYSDSLTGISNRLHFSKNLEYIIAKSKDGNGKVGLFFFDLNQFKEVNDTLGHPTGDQLLTSVAERIKSSSLPFQHFARTGGDEFILVFDLIEDLEDVQAYAERILDLFVLPFRVNNREISISTSIGIAIYPIDSQTPEELMKHADLAMYQAKAQGGNQYRLFDQGMLNQLLGKTELENDLIRAIYQEQLMIYYQPIMEIDSERIVGLEALVRWNHPTKGMISPAEFIPVAEESGLINPLTEWVLDEVCRQHQEWVKRGLPPIKIAVNLSGAWFHREDRVRDFFQLLHQYEIESQYIEIEITERVALMDDYYPVLEQMLAEGITVAIDDFGTDYSSLSYLKRFPVNKIKIDQTFIGGIGKNPIDETIVQAIIFVGRQLGYDVVAEGVETADQAEFLRTHRCRYAQGYLYYRPMPKQELEKVFSERFIGSYKV